MRMNNVRTSITPEDCKSTHRDIQLCGFSLREDGTSVPVANPKHRLHITFKVRASTF